MIYLAMTLILFTPNFINKVSSETVMSYSLSDIDLNIIDQLNSLHVTLNM